MYEVEMIKVPVAVKVQAVSAELNPYPVTVTVVPGAPAGADPVPTGGEPFTGLSVIEAVTVNTVALVA